MMNCASKERDRESLLDQSCNARKGECTSNHCGEGWNRILFSCTKPESTVLRRLNLKKIKHNVLSRKTARTFSLAFKRNCFALSLWSQPLVKRQCGMPWIFKYEFKYALNLHSGLWLYLWAAFQVGKMPKTFVGTSGWSETLIILMELPLRGAFCQSIPDFSAWYLKIFYVDIITEALHCYFGRIPYSAAKTCLDMLSEESCVEGEALC